MSPWKKQYHKEYRAKNKPKIKEANRKWRMENPERARELQKRSRDKLKEKRRTREKERIYGPLPPEPTNCESCGTPFVKGQRGKSAFVDHDHARSEFRGYLCLHCNSALGYAKDSRDRLQLLINYLDRYELCR